MKTTKTGHVANEAVEGDMLIRLEFQESTTVLFEQGSNGNMFVTIKGSELPIFPGQMFNQEFLDFLRDHHVSGSTIDIMFDGVTDSLRRGQAMEALMKTMK